MPKMRDLIDLVTEQHVCEAHVDFVRLWFNPTTQTFIDTGDEPHNVYVLFHAKQFGVADAFRSIMRDYRRAEREGDDNELCRMESNIENQEEWRIPILLKRWVRCGYINGEEVYAEGNDLQDVRLCLKKLLERWHVIRASIHVHVPPVNRLLHDQEIDKFLRFGRVR